MQGQNNDKIILAKKQNLCYNNGTELHAFVYKQKPSERRPAQWLFEKCL